ncbi:hypothetical protein [Mesorhizobium xinjiangense]|uniref:hypothetical protein n=1 Tax=Mesorhizobium xinjiangense TaxID=2678685 RepID=UPI0012EE11F6|nr:hypothetical protein [Mesorhizobium xinjiangense]
MKTTAPHISLMAAIVLAASSAGLGQAAMRVTAPPVSPLLHLVAADCNAIGRAEAARNGGQLRRAVAVQRGGRTICQIVYTVPGKGGKPPRRVQRNIPAG